MQMNIGVKGEYNIKVVRNGECRLETGWRPNLVLDTFLTRVSSNSPAPAIDYYYFCTPGSGSTLPSIIDVALEAPLASPKQNTAKTETGVLDTPNKISVETAFVTYQFDEGSVIGNLSELGFHLMQRAESLGSLDIRTLVTDSEGNPTTITLTAADQLIVYHKLHRHISLDSTQQMMIDGVDTTVRSAVGNTQGSRSNYFRDIRNHCMSIITTNSNYQARFLYSSISLNATDPYGAMWNYSGEDAENYQESSMSKPASVGFTGFLKMVFEPLRGTPAGGIGGLFIATGNNTDRRYQQIVHMFDPPIQKGLRRLEITFSFTWGRLP